MGKALCARQRVWCQLLVCDNHSLSTHSNEPVEGPVPGRGWNLHPRRRDAQGLDFLVPLGLSDRVPPMRDLVQGAGLALGLAHLVAPLHFCVPPDDLGGDTIDVGGDILQRERRVDVTEAVLWARRRRAAPEVNEAGGPWGSCTGPSRR